MNEEIMQSFSHTATKPLVLSRLQVVKSKTLTLYFLPSINQEKTMSSLALLKPITSNKQVDDRSDQINPALHTKLRHENKKETYEPHLHLVFENLITYSELEDIVKQFAKLELFHIEDCHIFLDKAKKVLKVGSHEAELKSEGALPSKIASVEQRSASMESKGEDLQKKKNKQSKKRRDKEKLKKEKSKKDESLLKTSQPQTPLAEPSTVAALMAVRSIHDRTIVQSATLGGGVEKPSSRM